MRDGDKTAHKEVAALKRRYEKLGYQVILEPSIDDLPIPLDNYRPDLIAIKPGTVGGHIIEVKESTKQLSIERLAALAEKIRSHKGWRFILVASDDVNVPEAVALWPTWEEVEAKLTLARALLDFPDIDPAILYLYSVFEASARKLAVAQAVPVERLQSTRVRNSLYTLGFISGEDYGLCKRFLSMRNQVAHGFSTQRDVDLARSFFSYLERTIPEWKALPPVGAN